MLCKDTEFFIKDYNMNEGGTEIKAEKIFIGSDTPLFTSPVKGLNRLPYLTNQNVSLLNI